MIKQLLQHSDSEVQDTMDVSDFSLVFIVLTLIVESHSGYLATYSFKASRNLIKQDKI